MPGKILNGTLIAARIKERLAEKIKRAAFPKPGLAVILIGDNAASSSYVNHKRKACDEIGIYSECHPFPATIDQQTIEHLIDTLNKNPIIHGILLQLPIPQHLDRDALLERIHPAKDVDGLHPYNMGRLAQQRPTFIPCTPKGVITLLRETGVDLSARETVVVGASNIVGRPMALSLLMEKSTVTICHSATKDLKKHVQSAEILITATGQHGIIQSDWIKEGAIVIDVGFSRLNDGKIMGDIDFESAAKRAAWITPVPGGVGPMTVASLLENTVLAAESY